MAFYQLVSLHPFSEANGRVARLLIVLQLVHYGVLREPLLLVAPWFTALRDARSDMHLSLRRTGDWNPWLRFFAGALKDSADATRTRVQELRAWRDRARQPQLSGLPAGLIDELICAPILTAPIVAGAHGVSRQGALRALRTLVDAGLVSEARSGRRLLFRAEEVLEIVRDPASASTATAG
jgi:Fic family protein